MRNTTSAAVKAQVKEFPWEAIRRSGRVTIMLAYVPPAGYAQLGRYMCECRTVDGRETVWVGEPRAYYLRGSVDSPDAFDSAASAALSFSDRGAGEHAEFNPHTAGWRIERIADVDDSGRLVRVAR